VSDWQGWESTKLFAVPTLEVAASLAPAVAGATLGQDWFVRSEQCDLREICRQGGFSVQRLDRRFAASSHDALLVPQRDGTFSILVDPIPKHESRLADDLARHRNRFRIAHEIGHSFFYDRSARPALRMIPWSDEEEAFCDEFASALLVPRSAIGRLMPDPANVFLVSQRYDVSVELAARAIARVHPAVSIAGLLWKPHPNKPGRPNLRVAWSAGHRFIPRHAALHSTVVNRAALEGDSHGVEHLNAAGFRGGFAIQAARMPRRKQVVVCLRPAVGGAVLPFSDSDSKVLSLVFDSQSRERR